MLRKPFLRIDVDRNLLLAMDLKRFLTAYTIDRVWMFRPRTCPSGWDEPCGLHVDDLEYFGEQLSFIEFWLGHVDYWNVHGCGMKYTDGMLRDLEKRYDRQCLVFLQPMLSLKTMTITGEIPVTAKTVDVQSLAQLVFHPQYLHTEQMDTLKILLDRIEHED